MLRYSGFESFVRIRFFGLISAMVIGFIVCRCTNAVVHGADPVRVIHSASEPDYPPLAVVDAAGNADGYSVELLRATLKAIGYDVTFKVAPWSQIKEELVEGRIDVLPLVGRTPERELIYDFTTPYLVLHGAIFVRDDETKIRTLADLVAEPLAVMQGDNAEEFVRREQISNQIVATATYPEAFQLLADGKVRAVIAQKLMGISLLGEMGISNIHAVGSPLNAFSQNFCFAVQEGNSALLAQLNEGLAKANHEALRRRLREKWFGEDIAKEWLERKIRVGGDYAYPPYEYVDENGNPTGYNVELTRALADVMGLDVEIELGPWNEIRRAIEEGRIDVVQGMFFTPRRDLEVDFSSSYQIIHHAVFAHEDSPVYESHDDLNGMRVAVMQGDVMHDFCVDKEVVAQLVLTESQEDAMALLAAEEVDYALLARLPGMYWIDQHGWTNLHVVESHQLCPEYGYAVLGGNDRLLNLFDEGLALLRQNGEYRRLREKWFGMVAHDTENFWPTVVKYALWIGGCVCSVLLLGVVWVVVLRRQVARKTQALESEVKDRLQAQEMSQRLDAAINQAAETVMITDVDGRIQYVNPAFELTTGYSFEEVQGLTPRILKSGRQSAELYEKMWATLVSGSTWKGRFVNKRKNGTTYTEDATISPVHNEMGAIVNYVGVKREITRELSLEAQMRQAQKMEAVGRLAGGVAHDLNNLLTPILGYGEMLLEDMPEESPNRNAVIQIFEAGRRARTLVQHLLAFGRKQTLEMKPTDLNVVLESFAKLLRRTIREDVEIKKSFVSPLPLVDADVGQLEQVVMNLCINAQAAMPHGGVLVVETGLADLEKNVLTGSSEWLSGHYVVLTVRDTGHGMEPEIQKQIFEPFFTTKGKGKGTGLGLATVYGIVTQHGGEIEVSSEPGKGATFRIYLPISQDQIASAPERRESPVGLRGTETILVVEDDDMVGALTVEILKRHGYSVIACCEGGDALQLLTGYDGPLDLLLTDVVMPNMNGRELARRVAEKLPATKVLFMSGYTGNTISQHGLVGDDVNFIHKPFSVSALLTKVRSVLDDDCAPTSED